MYLLVCELYVYDYDWFVGSVLRTARLLTLTSLAFDRVYGEHIQHFEIRNPSILY